MKAVKQTVRKYYKYYYLDESLTSLPTYASSTEATVGKMGISFNPTNIYPMVARSNNTYLPNSYGFDTIFTFEYGYILKTWSFSGWVIPNQLPSAGVVSVAGSNDKENWTNISNNGSNETLYKYYRLRLAGSEQWVYGSMGASYFNMNGLKRNRYVREVSSDDDYDFYKDVPIYKVVKETVRKYYKYLAWEQPILTSNTSSSEMTVSATNEGQGGAWKAFNGSYTDSGWVTSNSTLSGTVYATFKKPIYLKSITLTGYRNSYGYTKTISIYSDIAKTNLIGEAKTFFTSTGSTSNISNTWTLNEPIKVTDLAFYCVGGSNWVALSEVSINADIVVEGTPDDYDFYIDTDAYKAIKSYTKGQYYGN